jgi:hypothetical protein
MRYYLKTILLACALCSAPNAFGNTLQPADGNNKLSLHNTDRVFYLRFYSAYNLNSSGYQYQFKDGEKRDITIKSSYPVFDYHEIKGRLLGTIHNDQLFTNQGLEIDQSLLPQSKASFAVVNLTHKDPSITVIHNGNKKIQTCEIISNAEVRCAARVNETPFTVDFLRKGSTDQSNHPPYEITSGHDMLLFSLSHYNRIKDDNDFNYQKINYFNQPRYRHNTVSGAKLPFEYTLPSRPFKIALPSVRSNQYDINNRYRDTTHYLESDKPIILAANVLINTEHDSIEKAIIQQCNESDRATFEDPERYVEQILEGATGWIYSAEHHIHFHSSPCSYNYSRVNPVNYANPEYLKDIQQKDTAYPSSDIEFKSKHLYLKYTNVLSQYRYETDKD